MDTEVQLTSASSGDGYDFASLSSKARKADIILLHQYLLHPLEHDEYGSIGMDALDELGIARPSKWVSYEVYDCLNEVFMFRLINMEKTDPLLRSIMLTSLMTLENVRGPISRFAPTHWHALPCKILCILSHHFTPSMRHRIKFILEDHASHIRTTINTERISYGANNGSLFYLNSQLALNHPSFFYEQCNANIRTMFDAWTSTARTDISRMRVVPIEDIVEVMEALCENPEGLSKATRDHICARTMVVVKSRIPAMQIFATDEGRDDAVALANAATALCRIMKSPCHVHFSRIKFRLRVMGRLKLMHKEVVKARYAPGGQGFSAAMERLYERSVPGASVLHDANLANEV